MGVIELKKQRKKKKTSEVIEESFSDEQFAFIAGYTSGGAPYGVTWEEADIENDQEFTDIDDEDLPF
jgi:hypothetical protein